MADEEDQLLDSTVQSCNMITETVIQFDSLVSTWVQWNSPSVEEVLS